jgi:hypothetical protein
VTDTDAAGNRLILGDDDVDAKLFKFTPGTELRTALSDCRNTAQGPCAEPVSITPAP